MLAAEFAGRLRHSSEDLRRFLDGSLKALNTDCVDIWYLHSPDRTTPYEVTMQTVNELDKEGKLKRFGLSNYTSWEVAEIVAICRANSYVQPTVYQGLYNAMNRNFELELFACLRRYNITFCAFNPLGGGLFTGRYRSLQDPVEPGSRFDTSHFSGKVIECAISSLTLSKVYSPYVTRRRYWDEAYFSALEKVEEVARKYELTLAEVALRWLSYHSLLKQAQA